MEIVKGFEYFKEDITLYGLNEIDEWDGRTFKLCIADEYLNKYTITNITDKTVTLSNILENVIEFSQNKIDPYAHLRVGQELEVLNNKVPYEISLACRQDIRKHHFEEARNGDI